jgi:putative ABC transport system permease protein
VVLSHRLWVERFNASKDVVGRTLMINGEAHTILGVASTDFYFPDRGALLWTPYTLSRPTASSGLSTLLAFGRLRRDATIAQAATEATAFARGALTTSAEAKTFYGAPGSVVVRARALAETMTSSVRPAIGVVTAGAALLLLLSCANAANLLLARGALRRREFAVRASIGAGRARLARQLLTEAMLFALAGGALGLLLVSVVIGAGPALLPGDFPRADDIRLDARVIAFCVAVSLLTALVSGSVPLWRHVVPDASDSLRGDGGDVASGRAGSRLRAGILASEAAIAVMFLVAALLLGRSFVRLLNVPKGYVEANVLTARIHVATGPNVAARNQHLLDGLLERLANTQGVVAAGGGNMMPFGQSIYRSGFELPILTADGKPTMASAVEFVVTPGYAEALGLELSEGRFFAQRDLTGGLSPALVNETFARRYLPSGPVAGFRVPTGLGSSGDPTEIVGVIRDVRSNGLDHPAEPQIYLIARNRSVHREMYVVLRTLGDPRALSSRLRDLVHAIDPGAAVGGLLPLEQLVSQSVDRPRFAVALSSGLALAGLTLAVGGLYATLVYTLSHRRRELAIRSALGATRPHLVRLVLTQGLRPAVVGLGAGLAGAAVLTRFMTTLLFEVSPRDPEVFVGATALLFAAALVACLVPAWRAAAIDPATTLKRCG